MKRRRTASGRTDLIRTGIVLALAQGLLACGSSAGTTSASGAADGGRGPSSDGAIGHDGAATKESGASDASDGGFCSQTGPVVALPGLMGSYNICTSQIATTLFDNALCTCDDAEIAGYLETTAFNSGGGSSPGGAAVGINNSYMISAGYTNVGGSLSVAGSSSVAFIGYLETAGDLKLQGTATIPGYTQVGRNGALGGGFTDLGPASFKGDLTHQGSVLAIPLSVGGTSTMASVSIPPPCDCNNVLDIPALVAQGMANNDDAAIGLSPTEWTNVLVDTQATLPCGTYYLSSIQIGGSLDIEVTGRVALFIGADITVLGNLQFHLASTAEIDIFIQNDLNLVGLGIFGDKSRPAATRIYVGGSGNVNLVGAGEFVGNVYAPNSLVTAPGYLDVYGSIFSKDFRVPGYADFNYDSAITEVGDNCPPVKIPGQCTQCGECTNGLACVSGECGACTSDADCCGQLVCSNGQCITLGAPK